MFESVSNRANFSSSSYGQITKSFRIFKNGSTIFKIKLGVNDVIELDWLKRADWADGAGRVLTCASRARSRLTLFGWLWNLRNSTRPPVKPQVVMETRASNKRDLPGCAWIFLGSPWPRTTAAAPAAAAWPCAKEASERVSSSSSQPAT